MSGAARNPDLPMKAPFTYDDYGLAVPKFIDVNKETENDAYYYSQKNVHDGRDLPEFFITCGDKDFALERTQYAADYLKVIGYKVINEWVPGYGHEWGFWDLTLRKAIESWLPLKHRVIYQDEG
jgi:hypothetical protein